MESCYYFPVRSRWITHDGDGFLLAVGWKTIGQLTSDPVGNVAMAYGKQRVRIIEDVVPMLDDDYWPWEDDPIEPDSTMTSEVRIGRPAPNPNVGGIHLDVVLPDGVTASVTILDATGRRLVERELSGGESEQAFTWNGRLPSGTQAPAGVYYIKVNVDEREVIRKALLLR